MEKDSIPKIYLYRQIVAAKLYIDANFKENIDLESIANEACFSKFHFHRTFKECYHKTPLEYLTYMRLKEAKRLLAKGVSTKEVCYLIGFESISSFIKLFKKKEMLRPLEYAKRELDQREKTKQEPLDYIPSAYATYLGWKKE